MSLKNILLVEGEADRGFFELLCRQLQIQAEVKVAAPKDLSGRSNTKEGVFNYLPTLLAQLVDGQIERLSIILDADSLVNGGGFQKSLDRMQGILAPFGYSLRQEQSAGLVFTHNDGLTDLGLWLMPNNADEGMLEDWIKRCRHPDEAALFQHVEISMAQLPGGPEFKPLHRSKAEVATWLAWQKKPGQGLYGAVNPRLLDGQALLYGDLALWFKHMFPA